MRSAAVTTVSRTMVRIDSRRRSRRGRRVSEARVAGSVSVVDGNVFVVIFVPPEIGASALAGTESASRGAERTVGAEPPRADPAALQPGVLLEGLATDAD